MKPPCASSKYRPNCLPRITADNVFIHPASLVLFAFLPGDTVTLNVCVRHHGSVRFLGAGQQLSTRTKEGGRQHTVLTWHQQSAWERKYSEVVGEIARVLRDEGNLGPCGADIMDLESGTEYVIDLSPKFKEMGEGESYPSWDYTTRKEESMGVSCCVSWRRLRSRNGPGCESSEI